MIQFVDDVDEQIKFCCRILLSYTSKNIPILVELGKERCYKGKDGNWVIVCQKYNEDFLISSFRKIHRTRFGAVRWFNRRLKSFQNDMASMQRFSIPF